MWYSKWLIWLVFREPLLSYMDKIIFTSILDSSKGANEGLGEDPYGGSTNEDSDMYTHEAPGENNYR